MAWEGGGGGGGSRLRAGRAVREPPLRVLSCAKGVAEEGEGGAGPRVSQDLQRLAASASDCISKASTASTAARSTPGNHSRNCCTVAPSLRFSKRAETGTRVPVKTHAPLALSGSCSTFGHVFQSVMASPSMECTQERGGGSNDGGGPSTGSGRTASSTLPLWIPAFAGMTRVGGWVRGGSGGGGGGSRLRENDGVDGWVREGFGWRRGRFPPSRERRGAWAGTTGWGFRVMRRACVGVARASPRRAKAAGCCGQG